MSVPDATVATRTWLERPGVADRADSKVDALPHGNQQRVQLAAALVHGPELLVLDEPLAGLDPTGIDAIGEVLVEQARSGWCVLFASHQLDQIEDLCEEVTIIDHGHLVVTGRVDDVASSGPRRLVVRVEGDRDAAWARGIPGITVSEVDGVRRIRSGRDQRRALAPVPSAHQQRARVARGCRSGRSCRALGGDTRRRAEPAALSDPDIAAG
jgi:ABC-2 type transport system ATP-binding protein